MAGGQVGRQADKVAVVDVLIGPPATGRPLSLLRLGVRLGLGSQIRAGDVDEHPITDGGRLKRPPDQPQRNLAAGSWLSRLQFEADQLGHVSECRSDRRRHTGHFKHTLNILQTDLDHLNNSTIDQRNYGQVATSRCVGCQRHLASQAYVLTLQPLAWRIQWPDSAFELYAAVFPDYPDLWRRRGRMSRV